MGVESIVTYFARGETFDEQAMPECDSEALDFRAASESFASVRKIKRADLDTLRLMMKHQGRKVPTVEWLGCFKLQELHILYSSQEPRQHVETL